MGLPILQGETIEILLAKNDVKCYVFGKIFGKNMIMIKILILPRAKINDTTHEIMSGKNSMHNYVTEHLLRTCCAPVTHLLPYYAPITHLLRTYYASVTHLLQAHN